MQSSDTDRGHSRGALDRVMEFRPHAIRPTNTVQKGI